MSWELPETGTLTGYSGCNMSAHYYNEEGSRICWIQAMTWAPLIDKDHNFYGYGGSIVFLHYNDEPSNIPSKRFWIRIEGGRQGERGVASFHHVELKEPFSIEKAIPFTFQTKHNFE
jgi:hypothetical protein